jgi:hypothetical protein
MAISNIANINVGLPNESVGSDSLYTAFTKTRDNFTTLAACASPYNTFTGNGVSINANADTGVVDITNTGVTSIVAGTGVSISASNGAVTISSNGSGNGGSGTVTSVSLVSPNSTLNASGTIVSSGALSVDLNTIANVAGSYRSPNITVDAYGRVSSISNGNSGITSLSIIPGSGIAVTGSPATSTISNITVINTGVTRLNAGSGIAISGSNGNVTVGLSSIVGSVTSVGLTSSTLLVSGSPIVTSGVMSVNLPSSISLSGNITGGNLITSGLVTATGNITGGNLITSGLVTATGNITGGNLSGTLITGTLRTAAQPNVTSLGTLTSLSISGNAIVGDNLFVNGNLVYINVDTLQVEDPIINLGGGPNGAPLTTNDGKDRGLLLNYYTTTPVSAFMGWDNGNAEFTLGSNVSVANEVVTYNQLGNVRASTFIGSLLGNATTAGTITTNAQPNITSVGTLTSLSVTGNITANNISIGNVETVGVFTRYSKVINLDNANAVAGNRVVVTMPAPATVNGMYSGVLKVYSTRQFDNSGGPRSHTTFKLSRVGNISGANATFYVNEAVVDKTSAFAYQWYFDSTTGTPSLVIGQNTNSYNWYVESELDTSTIPTIAIGSNAGSYGTSYYPLYTLATPGTDAGGLTITASNSSNTMVFDSNGQLSLAGNITGGNLSGTLVTGTLRTAAQPNITSTGALTSLSVTGNISSSGNILVGNSTVIGTANNISTITAGIFNSITGNGILPGLGNGYATLFTLYGSVVPQSKWIVTLMNPLYDPLGPGGINETVIFYTYSGGGSYTGGVSTLQTAGDVEWNIQTNSLTNTVTLRARNTVSGMFAGDCNMVWSAMRIL